MKERPILFSAPMARAILEGRKTQTRRPFSRRLLTKQFTVDLEIAVESDPQAANHLCPYGQPGDRLWVRETHAIVPRTAYAQSDGVAQVLRPDDDHDAAVFREGWDRSSPGRWRPSIHMPRWASRILLEITDVRVQRVQDISEDDAYAEGAESEFASDAYIQAMGGALCGSQHKHGFANLWDSINNKPPKNWNSNPWVWALTFKNATQSA